MTNFQVCQLFCDNCNYKKIIDSNEKLLTFTEIKSSSIPNGHPKINPQTKKLESPKSLSQKRKFRCPECGFTITSKVISDTQKNNDEKIKLEQLSLERKKLEENAKNHNIRKSNENWIDGSETSIIGPPLS